MNTKLIERLKLTSATPIQVSTDAEFDSDSVDMLGFDEAVAAVMVATNDGTITISVRGGTDGTSTNHSAIADGTLESTLANGTFYYTLQSEALNALGYRYASINVAATEDTTADIATLFVQGEAFHNPVDNSGLTAI